MPPKILILAFIVNACTHVSFIAADSEDLDSLPREAIPLKSSAAVTAASFVLEELRNLSDSGIYETIELKSIKAAFSQKGVFHDNIHLTLELSSPHLVDGPSSTHSVMVMTSLEDGVQSFAIDDFPVMDEDAVEEFWIKRVEARRRLREESFARIEKAAKVESRHQEL